MTPKAIRKYCLSLPHATEDLKWEHNLCFCIAGKIFAILPADEGGSHGLVHLCVKCTPVEFDYLTRNHEGIIPAPYLARNHWVAFTSLKVLPDDEIMRLIQDSYELVKAKLPKKVRIGLES